MIEQYIKVNYITLYYRNNQESLCQELKGCRKLHPFSSMIMQQKIFS